MYVVEADTYMYVFFTCNSLLLSLSLTPSILPLSAE